MGKTTKYKAFTVHKHYNATNNILLERPETALYLYTYTYL